MQFKPGTTREELINCSKQIIASNEARDANSAYPKSFREGLYLHEIHPLIEGIVDLEWPNGDVPSDAEMIVRRKYLPDFAMTQDAA